MKGYVIPEDGHIVNALPPLDLNGAARYTDVISLAEYGHIDFIIQLGVTGAASTVTVEKCDNFTPSNSSAIAFSYYAETTDAGDTLAARAAATAAGFATSTNNNVFYVISIDAAELGEGYPCVRLALSDPGIATLGSVVAVLSAAKYSKAITNTAIA